jgi:DNA-binding YbaB/EbfC family protein
MKNIGQLMKQAQQMQQKMAEMQEQLAAVEMTGVAGGGMVQLTLNGKSEVKKIKLDKAVVDPQEIEVLEDLLVAAFNDARQKVAAHTEAEMQKLTGGLALHDFAQHDRERGVADRRRDAQLVERAVQPSQMRFLVEEPAAAHGDDLVDAVRKLVSAILDMDRGLPVRDVGSRNIGDAGHRTVLYRERGAGVIAGGRRRVRALPAEIM